MCTRNEKIPATNTLPSPATLSIATPANGIQSQVRLLTFGSFLLLQFQPICEEPEDEGKSENRLNPAGKRAARRTGIEIPRRLQFSDLAKSTIPTPAAAKPHSMEEQESPPKEEKPYQRNRSSQVGKALTCIPPDLHGNNFVVTIAEEDIKEQQE